MDVRTSWAAYRMRLAWLSPLLFLMSCSAFKPLPTRSVGTADRSAVGRERVERVEAVAESGLASTSGFDIERADGSQFRIAIRMDLPVESLSNARLYRYIDGWWATPYRLGGNGRDGIDCSAFVQGLQSEVFGRSRPRVTRDQQSACRPVPDSERREGDLVFFRTGEQVMHVGVYLLDHRFVHASTSRGVVIDDLRSEYWRKAYLGTGRPGSR